MNLKVFDTETQDGKAFLICTFNGKDYKDYYIRNERDVISFFNEFHGGTKLAFCYNLDYDASALIKYFGQDKLVKLYLGQSIIVGNLKIRYIPRKCLYITKYKNEAPQEEKLPFDEDELDPLQIEKFNRHRKDAQGTLYIWDVLQYYQIKLSKAAREHLKGEKKQELPEGWIRTLKKYFVNPKHRNMIIQYCRQDARLTWLLSKKFIQMLIDAGITTDEKAERQRYYSAGYIAKKYIKSKVNVPYITDPKVIDFMSNAYFGGRIEVMKRGYFDNAEQIDMNSAYPRALSDLKRIYHHEFSHKINHHADYFFADCEFTLKPAYIQPVPISFDIWKYPSGKMRATIDNRTFGNILKAGGTITHVHRSLNIFCESQFPFRATVHRLFEQRKKSDAHKYIFKMLLTAYTGKLNEKKYSTRLIPPDKEHLIQMQIDAYNKKLYDFENEIRVHCHRCYYLGKVHPRCRNKMCVWFRNEYRGVYKPMDTYTIGKNMFQTEKHLANGTNIIYAALVTSTIRNAVYEKGLTMGDNLIGFLTDAILTKKKVSDSELGPELGQFSRKYNGWLYLLGSGIYQTSNGTKFRGYNSDHDLIQLSKQNMKNDEMEIPSLQRVGMGRALGSPEKYAQFNMLLDAKPKMKVNFDRNRIWNNPFKNFGEALSGHIDSEPLLI